MSGAKPPVGETAEKLPADYGIAVGTEWIDDEGEVATITGIDDPATMYPIAFRWNDGHEGAVDVVGFCASFRPLDWTALAMSEASLRAESASLRQLLATAEADAARLRAREDEVLAVGVNELLRAGEATEDLRYWKRVHSDARGMLTLAEEKLRAALADAAALREQRDELRDLVSRMCGVDECDCDPGSECMYREGRIWLRAHPAPVPTEPDGASGMKETDR